MPTKKTQTKKSVYAVIQLQGKQFKVTEGETITVDHLDQDAGTKVEVTDVLLVADGQEVKVGTPLVEKAKVTLEVVDQVKGDKIRVATYKAKSRSRKVRGHRSHLTQLIVKSIK